MVYFWVFFLSFFLCLLLGRRGSCNLLSRFGLCAFSEPVTETTLDNLEMPHAAYALGPPATRLLAPSVLPHALLRVRTPRTFLLLDVEAAPPAPSAQCMRLVVTHTKTLRTLRHRE